MNARTQDAKPVAGPPTAALPVSVDFANVSGGALLVYGWILGLSKRVARAEIRYGEVLIDLMSVGAPVPRPDVAKHFPAQVSAGDEAHGFYLIAALPEVRAAPGLLRVSVWQKSGELSESTWPVSTGEAAVALFFGQHGTTLDLLLNSLRPAEANRLRALASPAAKGSAPTSATQLPFGIDACHLLDERIIVIIGWLNAGEPPVTAVRLQLGLLSIDGLPGFKIGASPPQPLKNLRGESRALSTFSWVGLLPETSADGNEVTVELTAASRAGSARQVISRQAYLEFAHSLKSMDVDPALDLLERISALGFTDRADLPAWLHEAYVLALERLPPSLETGRPRVYLHCEGVTPLSARGLFLNGWFHAEKGTVSQVACHDGRLGVRIDGAWVRLGRPDVAAHLKSSGVAGADEEHGFLSYAAFVHRAVVHYLSVTLSDGVVRRIRLPAVPAATSALHSIRQVLTSFALPHRNLRALLDRQIGPAVQFAWKQREAHSRALSAQRFGSQAARSAVSVIVPLYGRSDLAEYQMALFCDDADFQSVELIYFVDDPAIFDAFQAQCADLYGTYQVPFTLVFAGANLGFAGANNAAASVAKGEYLVLLNSDVFPKSPGWVSEMLASYGALKNPGLLGVKLLYEDGSVQHAGMNFRRHPGWADLWINEHPDKGLSAQGLTGLRQVDAVTAACAMVDARLYRELGGLSEDYIIGDFEDSDFCLRAAAAGRRNYVALDVELYHLERQSQARIGDSQWRSNLTLYNCWLHDQRWAAQIEKLRR